MRLANYVLVSGSEATYLYTWSEVERAIEEMPDNSLSEKIEVFRIGDYINVTHEFEEDIEFERRYRTDD